MWAIYHRDFGALTTTLHRLNTEIDDGEIILQGTLPVSRGMRISAPRRHNTEVCVDLALGVLDMLARRGRVPSRSQRCRGRYYSFMPAPLKTICQERFENYTTALAG